MHGEARERRFSGRASVIAYPAIRLFCSVPEIGRTLILSFLGVIYLTKMEEIFIKINKFF